MQFEKVYVPLLLTGMLVVSLAGPLLANKPGRPSGGPLPNFPNDVVYTPTAEPTAEPVVQPTAEPTAEPEPPIVEEPTPVQPSSTRTMTPREYLYATAPYPSWQDAVINCESRWDPSVTSWAGAQGLAQFMPRTWTWGGQLFGIYGNPYNPYDAIDMMNAFFAAGYASHWDCA